MTFNNFLLFIHSFLCFIFYQIYNSIITTSVYEVRIRIKIFLFILTLLR